MSHTIKEKSKLLARVRRIKGQIEAVERALEEEAGCAEVLQLVASARGAVSGLTVEIIEDHIDHHVLGAASEAERRHGAQQLIEVVRTYLK
jgi:DNA-binding FrmR family transcriptional regulator